jgi:hypothetical chaperone protein
MSIGFDFGTTNSSLAFATESGDVTLADFPTEGNGFTQSYRSLLYLQLVQEAGRKTIQSWSGSQGIERYLNSDDENGRLIQSLKSFLSSRGLQSTEVFGRRIQLEDLVARILRDIRLHLERRFGSAMRHVVVGRPVRFVGSKTAEDDDYAVTRLTDALSRAGFEDVRFEFEPIAAAYHYEARLDHDELILIGDFGGGTSDFSLLNVGPSYRKHSSEPRVVLGNQGLGLAGDAFDAKIVRHLVSPALGAGTSLKSGSKLLPVPGWVYYKLERWHHLSLLKSQETFNMLRSVARQAVEAHKIQHFLYLVKHDLGYRLHGAVQRVKIELSRQEISEFHFADGDVELNAAITRKEFEGWITQELNAIEESVDALLASTAIDPKDVDMVFLTGGSSFVPAVRRIFTARFGAEKIRTGDEFTSVARGLALRSLE